MRRSHGEGEAPREQNMGTVAQETQWGADPSEPGVEVEAGDDDGSIVVKLVAKTGAPIE